MTDIREKINQSTSLRFALWVFDGMVGGLVVGLILVGIYGWSLLSVGFWLGFGLLVVALSGGTGFVIHREYWLSKTDIRKSSYDRLIFDGSKARRGHVTIRQQELDRKHSQYQAKHTIKPTKLRISEMILF